MESIITTTLDVALRIVIYATVAFVSYLVLSALATLWRSK